MPVLGLIFLRYAYSRFKLVEKEILKNRPVRGGRVMPVVQQYAALGLQDIDDHLDQGLGGEEHPVVLGNVLGEFVEEIFIDGDYVMANPPFNVDKVNSESAQSAGRLPFGLPSVNKAKEATTV